MTLLPLQYYAGIPIIIALMAQILFSTRLVLNLRQAHGTNRSKTEWGMVTGRDPVRTSSIQSGPCPAGCFGT
jgi:hypothetical protein